MKNKIKIKSWIIFEKFGTNEVPYIFNSTELDVSEEELSLCIMEQIYGELINNQESSRVEKLVEGGVVKHTPSQTKETTNEVSIDNDITIHPDTLKGINALQGLKEKIEKGCKKRIPAGFDKDKGYQLYDTCGLTLLGDKFLCPECKAKLELLNQIEEINKQNNLTINQAEIIHEKWKEEFVELLDESYNKLQVPSDPLLVLDLKDTLKRIAKELENKKGCGKETEWDGRKYKCGQFEDLKHSDHIILCSECEKELGK